MENIIELLHTLNHSAVNAEMPNRSISKLENEIEELKAKDEIIVIGEDETDLVETLKERISTLISLCNLSFDTEKAFIEKESGRDVEFNPFVMEIELDEMKEEYCEETLNVIEAIQEL